MKFKIVYIFIFCFIFITTTLNAVKIKKNLVIKTEKTYKLVFYPVKVKGTIENMRYYYIYRVKFVVNAKKSLKINNIRVFLPENSPESFSMKKTVFLHKGKYIFILPVKKKKNIEFDSFKIRFYFNGKLKEIKSNNPENKEKNSAENKKLKNSASKEKKNNEKNYKEYIIRKADFKLKK